MNRNDKLIVALLFLTLMGWLWYSNDAANKARERALAERSAIGALSTNTATTATLVQATNVPVIASTPLPDIVVQVPPTPTVHLLPEETNVLHSAEMDLMISSRGATLRAATLPAYRTRPEKNSGPVILDFDPQPALALSGLPDVPIDADYSVRSGSNNTLTLTFVTQHGLQVQRTIALREYHQVVVTDRITNTSEIPLKVGTNWVSLGTFYRGGSKNDELSVDSFAIAPGKQGAPLEHGPAGPVRRRRRLCLPRTGARLAGQRPADHHRRAALGGPQVAVLRAGVCAVRSQHRLSFRSRA